MEKLLAMILTAYDPRRNPAAGLFWNAASRAFKSVASLAGTLLDERPSSASSYPQKSESSREGDVSEGSVGRRYGKTVRVLTSSGKIITVPVAIE